MSTTVGVGRRWCSARDSVSSSSGLCAAAAIEVSFQSRAVWVGSDEDAGATVGSSGIGSSYNEPARVIPERGKVPKDIGKSQREVSGDVLQDDESRSQRANGGGNVGPEVSLIGLSLPLSCVGERLARVGSPR